MNNEHLLKLSKTLSWILRYQLVNFKLPINSNKCVSMDDITKLQCMKKYSTEDINQLLRIPELHEKYFYIEEINDQLYLRAKFGLSHEVESRCNMYPIDDVDQLIYKTNSTVYSFICKTSSIKMMYKKYFYFSTNNNKDSNNIHIYLDVPEAKNVGIEFFTHNGVIVCSYGLNGVIPWECILKIVNCDTNVVEYSKYT